MHTQKFFFTLLFPLIAAGCVHSSRTIETPSIPATSSQDLQQALMQIDFGAKPSASQIRAQLKQALAADVKDPDSVKNLTFNAKPQRCYLGSALQTRRQPADFMPQSTVGGWCIPVTFNAMNSFAAYTGQLSYTLVMTTELSVLMDQYESLRLIPYTEAQRQ